MKLLQLFLIFLLVHLMQSSKDSSNNDVVKRNAHHSNTTDCTLKHPYLQILRGRDGRDGLPGRDGEKGDKGDKGERGDRGKQGPAGPKNGGVVYTRWGRKSCPINTGAQLLYEGIVGGSGHGHSGGGANYICLPKVPDYLSTANPPYSDFLYGAEYQDVNSIFPSKHDHNVPCAVCYTSTKVIQLMIPAKSVCPTSWTVEYVGYLMADKYDHKRNAVYECVDKDAESIYGSSGNVDGALFYFVKGTCIGLPCPPYVNNRVITCVVCTK